jgi:uncharacterized LabA/DUF88 family protein
MQPNAPAVPVVKRSRCTIYIDGFNMYYGAIRGCRERKWLNIQGFFEELRKDDDVITINLFTALVGPENGFSATRNRQKRYLKALESLSKVKVTYGYFQLRDKYCLATCKDGFKEPEEKKTDVNIAVSIINDAVKNLTDSIVVVSGDSDIQPAIEWVVKNFPKIKITVYVPSSEQQESERRSDYYRRLGVVCRFLPLDKVLKHQLPKKMWLKNGETVERPEEW